MFFIDLHPFPKNISTYSKMKKNSEMPIFEWLGLRKKFKQH